MPGRVSLPMFVVLLLGSLLLYAGLYLLLNWTTFSEDDAHILSVAARQGWLEVYFRPESYQLLSVAHYTPVVLTVYKALLGVAGLDSHAFLLLQLLGMALLSALSGWLCLQLTQRWQAAWLVMLLLFSNGVLATMITRFYTVHYVIGGILTLFAFVLFFRSSRAGSTTLLLMGLLLFFAMLAKEVYLMAPVLLVLLAACRKDVRTAAVAALLALLLYALLRWHILGFSSEGRGGQNYFSELLSLTFVSWCDFGIWYLQNKTVLVLFSLLAMVMNPRTFLPGLFVALLFALPALAAPHGFALPHLHADRIFFAFDCALAIAATVALCNTSFPRGSLTARWAGNSVLPLLFGGICWYQYESAQALAADEMSRPDYPITQFILASADTSAGSDDRLIVFVPLGYQQGELMNVYRMLGKDVLHIVQNCEHLLKQPMAGRVVLFDEKGERFDLNELHGRCQVANPVVTVLKPVQFSEGLLEWHFQIEGSFSGGVLFLDRGIAVATSRFSERLVRPVHGERYQIFARANGLWWSSEVQTVSLPTQL